ncbi:MAG: PAS domain S-box protein [Desulfobacterales bacterium]|nr:PAS domain S-box protein [Desulfobacterales bacterium]
MAGKPTCEQLEQKVKELEEKNLEGRALLNATTDAVVLLDPRGMILEINETYARRFHQRRDDLLGTCVWDLFPSEVIEPRRANVNKVFETGQPVSMEDQRHGVWNYTKIYPICNLQGKVIKVAVFAHDITEPKLMEQTLLESEKKYRSIFENITDGYYRADLEGNLILVSPSGVELLGYDSAEEMIGKNIAKEFYGDPQEREYLRKEILKHGKIIFQGTLKRKDGTLILTETNSRLVHDQTGKPIAVEGIFRDITEHKRADDLKRVNERLRQEVNQRKLAEEALKESEETYRLLVNNLPGFVFKGFKDWSVEFYDNKVEVLTGYNVHTFNSGRMKWIDLIVPDDIEPARKIFIRALKTDKSYARDYRITTKAGNIIWIQERGYIVCNENGDIEYVSGVFYDITDRKFAEENIRKSEKKYRELYKGLRDGFTAVNMEGTITEFNPAFQRMLGYPEEEIRRLTYENITPKKWHPIDSKILEEQVFTRGYSDFYEKEYIGKDGRVFPVEVRTYLIRDEEGHPEGMWTTIRDITDRKEAEKQLLHFQKMEAVGTLAGGIAHDFNNLLQAIQGYADLLLLDKNESDAEYRKLQQIAYAAQRGGELTRQLLTFSRKVESKKLLLDLNRTVRQAINLLKRTIPKMIDIELRLAEPLKAVNADPSQVEQVIMNLAINAKDAMPEGGRLIIRTENASLDEEYCRTHLGATPGDYVLLTVSDTGHGMNRGTLDRIFEPFFTTKEVGKGTGLGLAIVYGIVKSYHGYITCSSEPGAGTSFKIYFPAMDKEAEPEEQETEAPVSGGTETVLLVDDEDAIRDLGKQILEKLGYNVLTAVDGESALDLYRREQGRIDLVILDLIMPGMGGKRCLEKLLKSNARAKVVIASGYSDTGPVKETIEKGAKNFIGKPYEIRKMLEMVRQVLDED